MMFVGGLDVIRSGVLIASLPLLFVGVAMAISLRKSLHQDEMTRKMHAPKMGAGEMDGPGNG